MSLTIPPLGDGDDDGDGEEDGDDPVIDDTADATGEVTEDPGDDSAGAGPTPPAATCEECVHGPDRQRAELAKLQNLCLIQSTLTAGIPEQRLAKLGNMSSIQSNPTKHGAAPHIQPAMFQVDSGAQTERKGKEQTKHWTILQKRSLLWAQASLRCHKVHKGEHTCTIPFTSGT